MQKIEKFKIKYKKSLGQNFLYNKNIIKKIINNIKPEPNDIFIEIGAGSGNLTKELSIYVKKIFAVEIDRDIIPLLEENLKYIKNIDIINKDFLKINIKDLIKNKKIKIVGNIPYNITTPIIEKLINNREIIEECFLTLQKEVAERIVAKKGKKYSPLSIFVQFYSDVEKLFNISKKNFYPVPEVDSSFLKIKFKDKFKNINSDLFFKIVRGVFNQRRKTILNNLKRVIDIDSDNIKKILNETGISFNARPEDIPIIDFAKLTQLLYNYLKLK